MLLVVLATMLTAEPMRAGEARVDGLAWRDLTDTAGAGLTWQDVTTVCPTDGRPCQGSVKGVDFTGWIWASRGRVEQLIDVLTGLAVPTSALTFESPVVQFFDALDPVYESSSVSLSLGMVSDPPPQGTNTVGVLLLQDAKVSAGEDKIIAEEITTSDSEGPGGFFGPQPLGVFLVRDPDLEICGNGVDDDGNGQIDTEDDDCIVKNPVVNGLEWRQPAATTNISYWDVFSVCPIRGEPCDGTVGGRDFSGWTWASYADVQALLETLTGWTIPIRRPYDSNFTVPFFNLFQPTNTVDANQVRDVRAFANDAIGEKRLSETSEDPASCFNGIDDDGDGDIDELDAFCNLAVYLIVRDSLVSSIEDSLLTVQTNPDRSFESIGYFMYRDPQVATREICGNTLDDDGDGLIDRQDLEDCPVRDTVGLRVRCMHDPIYVAQSGDIVTIRAEAVDRVGNPVDADSVYISLGFDKSTPQASASFSSSVTLEYPPSGNFSYACGTTRGFEGDGSGWRTVAVGGFDPDFPAVPVIYNGGLDEKIDIVFFHDRDEYSSSTDPDFIEDVGLLINGGYFTIPWFVENQDAFNFWIGRDAGNSGPDPSDDMGLCFREPPDKFGKTYKFADAAGIVHRSACRDNAGAPGIFTIEVDLRRLQVVAHESGHRPFGLADEYCCDGGYYTRDVFGPPYPNMFQREAGCRNKGEDRGYDPDACRSLIDIDTDKDWWLFEPDYSAIDPEPPDLMQQQGCDSLVSRSACQLVEPTLIGTDPDPNGIIACLFPLDVYRADPDGMPASGDEGHWVCRRAGSATNAIWGRLDPDSTAPFFDRYDVGDSEEDRMDWMLEECEAGRC